MGDVNQVTEFSQNGQHQDNLTGSFNNSEPRGDFVVENTATEFNDANSNNDDFDNDDFDDVDLPHPISWATLNATDAEREWLALNSWVEELRHTFALPAQVVPPFWHRHPILVEHLSALHTHHLVAFDVNQNASGPHLWIRDLAEWESRAREVVARLGTRIDADRPHQIARWPGEPAPDPADAPPPVYLADRYSDFVDYVAWDLRRRRTQSLNRANDVSRDPASGIKNTPAPWSANA